jgi:ERCC4-type nuclease
MLNLIIDSREKTLFNSIMERDLDIYIKDITIQNTNLELGDIKIIINNDIYRELIFERKTLNDLISSIHDGRYKEQKTRLLSNFYSYNITYIIEGDDISKSIDRNNKKISSAYMNMLYRDNIHLIFTKNIFETTNFILSLCSKIIDKPSNYINNNMDNNFKYTDCIKIKSKKNDNITPDNCFILQLSQIPNISNIIAKNITNIFPNIRELIKELDKYDNENDKIKVLSSIDKVGIKKAKNILKYMKL